MKGNRWISVKSGYKLCLEALSKMKEILITTFTFDDNVNPHVDGLPPSEAILKCAELPFTGKGTNYSAAFDFLVNRIEDKITKYQDYLNCVVFLSDGQGGYPEDLVNKIAKMKEEGKKILFYTVAYITEEDEEMQKIVQVIKGDHYKVNESKASRAVFLKILGVY